MKNVGKVLSALGVLALLAGTAHCGNGGGNNDGGAGGDARGDGGASGDGATRRGTWAVVASGTDFDLFGVGGSAADNVFAAGSTVLRRFNGTMWGAAGAPNGFVNNALSSAGGLTVAVGGTMGSSGGADTGMGVVLTAMGAATSFSMGTVPAATKVLQGVFLRTAMDGWAVGDMGTILRFNGSTWAAVSAPTTMDLYGVWASAADSALIVGAQVLRWNGTAWAVENVGSTAYFHGIWGFAANDIWIAGVGGDIRHWNGTAWQNFTATSANYVSVWGRSPNDVWFVGNEMNDMGQIQGAIRHWNGAIIEVYDLTNLPTAVQQRSLTGVWGPSTGTDVWAVGEQGTTLRFSP